MMNEKEMKEFLKSQLIKEAGDTLAEAEEDRSLEGVCAPQEMDDKLFAKIQAHEEEQAAYEKLSDKDKEALRLGREMQMLREMDEAETESWDGREGKGEEEPGLGTRISGKGMPGKEMADKEMPEKVIKFSRRKRKAFAVVIAVAVFVLALGIVSMGGAPFITDIWKAIIGDREMVQVDTGKEGSDSVSVQENDEASAYQRINEEFGIEAVRWGYMPSGTKFLVGDIDKNVNRVTILYEYQGNVIEYRILLNYDERVYGYDIEDDKVEETEIMVADVPVTIQQYKADGRDEWFARFEYNGVFYTINGRISEEEFVKIIQSLIFS